MPTVFDSISERFYAAYFEFDVKKRRKAIERWVDSSVPVIQRAIKTDLRSHLEQILETRWTTEGWQSGVKKFMRRMDSYRLVLSCTNKHSDVYSGHVWKSNTGNSYRTGTARIGSMGT